MAVASCQDVGSVAVDFSDTSLQTGLELLQECPLLAPQWIQGFQRHMISLSAYLNMQFNRKVPNQCNR